MHTALPNSELGQYLADLFCERCWHCREVCPCDPQPLPEPKPSATVRTLQRGTAAENAAEPVEAPAEVTTPDEPVDATSGALGRQNGPVCGLFPPKRGAA